MKIKTVTLNMKHSDLAVMALEDENGVEVFEHDGYMPEMGILGGDYTDLTIDNATGQIIGWKPITPEDVAQFKNENGDNDEDDDDSDDDDDDEEW